MRRVELDCQVQADEASESEVRMEETPLGGTIIQGPLSLLECKFAMRSSPDFRILDY
jgi:hypothetical protein